jgi:hypothetical protein
MKTTDINLDNIYPNLVHEAMCKVLRQRNAEKFIETLSAKFTDKQRENFIEVLCNYEKFLDKQ